MSSSGFTIGEVLTRLKGDFTDITISKIRFLESEGLITPERTPSGYRKFTEDDVERLRFILAAQRDHYLPLRVIRTQLERLDSGEPALPAEPGNGGGAPTEGRQPAATQLSWALQAAVAGGDRPDLRQPPATVQLSLREFCEATQLEAAQVRALREFGVIGSRSDEGGTFDGEDLVAGRVSHELLGLGLEARHLRMYRQFADREAALFEQMVTPMLRQRDPEGRQRATAELAELANLTARLQGALLTRLLRGLLHGT